MSIIRTALVAALMTTATCAVADADTGIFFGGNVGYVDHSADSARVASQFAPANFAGSLSTDDSDLGWKAYFGYSFTQYFGLEFAYVDLGETKANLNATAPVALTQAASLDVAGYSLSAVARWPMTERFELMAKFGGFFWDSDFDSAVTTGGTTVISSLDDDGTDMTAGLGVKFQVSDHVGVRAEWDRYIDISDASDDADLFSMGIEFNY